MVKAIALVISTVGTDFAAGNYNVSFTVGVTAGFSDLQTGGFAQVPFMLKPKKADEVVRKVIADKIFVDFGLIIDPDDIYIPFSRV